MEKERNYGLRYGILHELEAMKVKRFIWHVTDTSRRADIFKHGLLPAAGKLNLNLTSDSKLDKGLLFANNLDHNLMNMWPVRFSNDQGLSDYACNFETKQLISKHEMGLGFDFWRIDTKKTSARWFVDPILAGEWWGWGLDSQYHYVCTPERIGIEALALFEFNPEFGEKSFVKWGDGVAHISFNHLPLKRAA